jgi:hypothetical protein
MTGWSKFHAKERGDMSDETIPGQLEEIRQRLDEGDRQFVSMRQQLSENTALTRENTRVTLESAEVVRDIRDALVFARVGTKIIKWLGGLGAVIATGFTLWSQWRKP